MEILIMIKLIDNLKTISKGVNAFISANNDSCVSRERKNDIHDALLYKLYYSKSNTTQEDATIKVNRLTKSEPSSRQALAKKESKIPLAIYEQLSNTLHKLTKKHIYNNHTKQIIAYIENVRWHISYPFK